MSAADLRFAFVLSGQVGSVMNEVLKNPFVRARTQLAVVDHDGTAAEKSRRHGVPTIVIEENDPDAFSERLVPVLERETIDYVFSFYTKFYSPDCRRGTSDHIINFHPSLLPSFKGDDGFGDAVAYGAGFTGNTVELIEDVMDEGKIIMQTVCPIDLTMPIERTRHQVFVQQCRSLIQVAHWLQEGRVQVDGRRVTIDGARFDDLSFSPALDAKDAAKWTPPDPFAS